MWVFRVITVTGVLLVLTGWTERVNFPAMC